ncbi:MAG: hypothetical protein K8U57_28570 [Planctomycetes bacterium]|nr:hypothetical protein [Planctomycetota bacterium]
MLNCSPPIDFTKIAFPSDNLAIGQLRRVWPHRFDVKMEPDAPDVRTYSGRFANRFLYGRHSLEKGLGELIDSERRLASLVFKEATGQPLNEEEAAQPLKEWIRRLSEFYVQVGLAQGLNHGKQLIHDLITEVQLQAESPVRPPVRRR